LARVPVVVRLGDLGLPVVLDKILEVLAVCWCRVWNIVIRQPSLKLSFVPFVIDCGEDMSAKFKIREEACDGQML